jgi:hypothetical protein
MLKYVCSVHIEYGCGCAVKSKFIQCSNRNGTNGIYARTRKYPRRRMKQFPDTAELTLWKTCQNNSPFGVGLEFSES